MPETVDKTKPYEEQRSLLGNIPLRDMRILMMQSRGLLDDEDEVLKNLNGHSHTPLMNYLEETLYRPKHPENYHF